MRYRLLHLSSYVPLLVRVLLDGWCLKLCWCVYLFFAYILLEHRRWNNYDVRVWFCLQRRCEVGLMCSLLVHEWFPWLCPLGMLVTCVNPGRYHRMWYVLVCGVCLPGPCGTAMVLCELQAEFPLDWHSAVVSRVVCRHVQVCVLVSVYTGYGGALVCFGAALKCACYAAAEPVAVVGWDCSEKGAFPVILSADKVHKV